MLWRYYGVSRAFSLQAERHIDSSLSASPVFTPREVVTEYAALAARVALARFGKDMTFPGAETSATQFCDS